MDLPQRGEIGMSRERMAIAWAEWLRRYGYVDGMDDADMADMGDAEIRIMATDYLCGCDEYDAEYDADISADMIAWARR